MDFKMVLGLLLNDFQKENIRYGLIGGFALGLYGIHRSTVDLDFLVLFEDIPKIEKIMEKYGYECAFKSENVSQYISPLKPFGLIDYLHAFKKTAVGMLKRAKEIEIFEKELKIKVIIPEDIIGLKIQAAANDKNREESEYIDIKEILGYYRKNLNWGLIEEYFLIFEQKEKFEGLKRRFYVD
ncbi:MAG: hypothetical protein AB1595_06375 [bacterium]